MADAILFYGQSNAGGGGHAQSYLIKPVRPDQMFTFRSAWQIYATSTVDPSRLNGLGFVKDAPQYAPFPAVAMAYALAHATPEQPYFIHTVWYGGQPLAAFMRGTDAWRNLTNVANRMGDALAENGMRGRVSALVMIQGEAGPPGRENYAHLPRTFLDQTLPDLQAATGQAHPPFALLMQTNESNVQGGSGRGVALAQWDVAQSRAGDTVLAGPMYQFPLHDAVHQSAEGRMMLGDLLAHVFRAKMRGEPFQPLHPLSARLQGQKIVVTFKRPPGALPLRFDDRWVPPSPHFGFALSDDDAPVDIASVEITGSSEVTIRLARRADKPMTLRYAIGKADAAGWASSRGQLMAPTDEASAFASLEVNVPKTIAHYAIRFEIAVE